jgi:YVTN family beta-propeller protein
MVTAFLGVGIVLAGCGGGGGGGGGLANSPLTVNDAQAFPSGKFLPVDPSPATQNQCIWIELTADVDPLTVFDASTSNGLSSNVRLLSYFYEMDAASVDPTKPLMRERLPGIPVLNGWTNFDFNANAYRSVPTTQVTNASLNIDANIPLVSKHANYLVIVADSDGDPNTIESFLPGTLKSNTSRLQNSQIMVNLTSGVRSTGGRQLEPEFITNFIVGEKDQIPPVVDATVPGAGEASVDVASPIEFTFSEPIDASSIIVAPIGSKVPTGSASANIQLSVQVIPPGQSIPQLINVPGSIAPSSGQTTSITFTPLGPLPGGTLVVANLYSAASTLAGATPWHPALSDPSGNPLSPTSLSDGNFTFTTGPGPQLANNPIDPEAIHFITSTSGMGTVRTSPLDRAATGIEDTLQKVNGDGDVVQFFPGGVQDGVVGPWIARLLGVPGANRNSINDPPRQCQYWLAGLTQRGNPPTTNVVAPGEYTPPGYADDILCTATTLLTQDPPTAPPPPNYCPESSDPNFPNIKPAQPYGTYLFVTNEAEDVIHCVSSHTFQVLKDIRAPDPRGLAISPDLSFLYVTNFGANSLSVIDVTAGSDGLPSGESIRVIPVGGGPWGVAAQPNGEDILVCNRLGKSVSVITVSDLGNPADPVRVVMQSGDPFEVTAGPRLGVLGLPYYAYVTNPGTDEVVIFESGPPQINGFGRDQVVDVIGNLGRPTGISGDQWYNTSTYQNPIPFNDSMTGAFVVLAKDGTVVHLKATRFTIPLFPNPPPALVEARFEASATFRVGENPADVCVDNNILWCNTPEGKMWPYLNTTPPAPVTAPVSRLYVTNGDGSISVYDIATGREFVKLEAGGARKVFGYYKQ